MWKCTHFLSHLSYYHYPRFDMVYGTSKISPSLGGMIYRGGLCPRCNKIREKERDFFEFYYGVSVLNLCDSKINLLVFVKTH